MAKQVVVSQEGFNKTQEELEFLKTVKRTEIKLAIKKAREYGDLSENSEYDEAKKEQAEVETRIAQLEENIKHAVILDDKNIKTDAVSIGCKVQVKSNGREFEYTIVGSTEADPLKLKISDESPIGKALIGMRIGESKVVEIPTGNLTVEVVGISK